MSWSGFKKNVGRATTQVMMKTGHVEKTSDREYEVEERRYRNLESASLRLQKEAKSYLDSLRAMTASQMRIAETIDAFYGDSGARDGVSRSYKQAVEDLDAETVKALDGPYRCVSPKILKLAHDSGLDVAEDDIRQIEAEMNWTHRKRRFYAAGTVGSRDYSGLQRACELMEYVYRTTVLEPINRFCAYFPDVNECIKKRNHKMLDYDSMRSKVKKLVEKPDKDPSKLPRTEKETEMVYDRDFILKHALHKARSPSLPDDDADLELSMPSPPKILERPEIMALRRSDTMKRLSSLARSPSVMSKVTNLRRCSKIEPLILDEMPQHSSSFINSAPTAENPTMPAPTTSEDCVTAASQSPTRSFSMPASIMNAAEPTSPTKTKPKTPSRSHRRNNSADRDTSRPSMRKTPFFSASTHVRTPFFNPSELEDIMAPLREEYIQKEADSLDQAKAAYEQLNEQLTNELPQLIDLRVPYLDPSFEALVKIQLRFCAEAYSRMAQVQQYLDASTRDQYANGDLDARVEDVLGQIRELSIAGTV